jgi:hypothetical protein
MGPEDEPACTGSGDKQVHKEPTADSFPASAVFRVFLFWEWSVSLKSLAWVQQDLCPVFLQLLALAVQELCPVFFPNLAVPEQLCAAVRGVWVVWESQVPASVRSGQAKYPEALADPSMAQGAILSEAGPLSWLLPAGRRAGSAGPPAELLPEERRVGFGAVGQVAVEIHRGPEVGLLVAWSGSEPF